MYPPDEDQRTEPHLPQPLDASSVTLIDTEDAMTHLLSTLRHSRVLAFDLREHRYHSYLGLICVIAVISLPFCHFDFDRFRGFSRGRAGVTRLAPAVKRGVHGSRGSEDIRGGGESVAGVTARRVGVYGEFVFPPTGGTRPCDPPN